VQIDFMKTRSGWFHLRGLFLLSAVFAAGSMLCASAVAGPITYRESTTGRPHMAQDIPVQKTIRVYVFSSASAIPKPIEYIVGGVLTTPTPIQFIGRNQSITR
jgi:hypothetical protein